MTLPTGVLPVLQMPYFDDESIDFEALERECDMVLEQGADGVCFALASELLRLDTGEREAVVERIGARVAGRAAFVAGIGAESTAVARRHALHAAGSGATALMATPPLCTRAIPREIERYYDTLADSVDLPLIVQDASAYVGAPIDLDIQIRLARRHGTDRIAFKPEADPVGPVIRVLRDALGSECAIYEGAGGAQLAEHFATGLAGTIPGSEMVPAIVALWRALQDGDTSKVRRLDALVGRIQGVAQGLDGYLALEKHRMVKTGMLPSPRVRGPVGFQWDPETRAAVDAWFDELDREVAA